MFFLLLFLALRLCSFFLNVGSLFKMLMISLIVFLFLTIFNKYLSYNVDIKFPMIFQPENNFNGSLFGASLMAIKTDSTFIFLIGAPKADNVYLRTKRSGAVYVCDIREHDSLCKQIQTVETPLYDEYGLGDMFLGGNMVYLDRFNFLVTCSHLRLNVNIRDNSYPTGSCNVIHVKSPFIQLVDKISPFQHSSMLIHHGTYYYSHAMLGFSSTYTSDESFLILGAPGFWGWRGAVVICNIHQLNLRYLYHSTLHHLPQIELHPDIYFGYSLATGKFFDDDQVYIVSGAPRFNYTGAVYYFNMGKLEDRSLQNVIRDWKMKQGDDLGEYFGSTLLVLDCNNDGRDDLIVGAPHFSLDQNQIGDSGRIFVYTSSGYDFNGPEIYMGDQLPGAQFGSSLAECGDLNQDGYKDVVVGAPYEYQNRGSVYIYLGSKTGLQKKYTQKISAASHLDHLSILGFGLDLDNGQDIDHNQYPDLLVGSYLSDKAVILRSHPLADIQGWIKFDVDHINLNNQTCVGHEKQKFACFQVTYCLKMSGKHLNWNQKLEVKLELDTMISKVQKSIKRGMFQDKEKHFDVIKQQVDLIPNQTICSESIQVLIKPHIQDTSTPIEFTLTSQLINESTTFCSRCPVAGHISAVHEVINIETDCELDEQCLSQIVIKAHPKLNNKLGNSFLIEGSQDFIDLDIVVSNSANSAHFAQLEVKVGPALNLISHSHPILKIEHDLNTTLIQMDIDNPFKKGSLSFNFRFDLSALHNDAEIIIIDTVFTSKSKLTDDSKTNDHQVVPIKRFANISLISYEDQIVFYTHDVDSLFSSFSYHPQFSFLITLNKTNYSSVKSILIEIKLPVNLSYKAILLEPKIEPLSAISIDCNNQWVDNPKELIEDDTNWDKDQQRSFTWGQSQNDLLLLNCQKFACKSMICRTSALGTNEQIASFKFSSTLNLTVIESHFGKNYNLIKLEVEAMASISDNLIETSSEKALQKTKIKVEFRQLLFKEKITFWLIIFSGFVSIILLTILFLILFKVGFFERKERKRIEQLSEQLNNKIKSNIKRPST